MCALQFVSDTTLIPTLKWNYRFPTKIPNTFLNTLYYSNNTCSIRQYKDIGGHTQLHKTHLTCQTIKSLDTMTTMFGLPTLYIYVYSYIPQIRKNSVLENFHKTSFVTKFKRMNFLYYEIILFEICLEHAYFCWS